LRSRAAPKLFHEGWLDRARIEDRFETACRELLNLLSRQLYPMALRDLSTDLAHDLLDIDVLARTLVATLRRSPVGTSSVRSASAAMEVLASA
jgi:hypothetical protein